MSPLPVPGLPSRPPPLRLLPRLPPPRCLEWLLVGSEAEARQDYAENVCRGRRTRSQGPLGGGPR